MTTKEKRGAFIFVAMFLGTGATGALLTISANENDTYRVSTCWLGFDYGNGWPSPVIFETLAFDVKTGKPYAEYLERYCYEEEALAGHKMVCEKLGVKLKESNE